MTVFALDSLDLAALLCSKVCHDVISPVGAIANGLEVLDDEKDPEMRSFALDLIRSSAQTASAKLQFCRLAFGAAGSAGATIDTGDAEKVARGLFADDKTKLEWNAPRILMAKNKVKLLLNMCMIAASAISRGGLLKVAISGEEDNLSLKVEASGGQIRLAGNVAHLIVGNPENNMVDAHSIQPFYTGVVARSCDMALVLENNSERITLAATPVSKKDDVKKDEAESENANPAEAAASQTKTPEMPRVESVQTWEDDTKAGKSPEVVKEKSNDKTHAQQDEEKAAKDPSESKI